MGAEGQNQHPMAKAGADQRTTPNALVTLRGQGADPDGEPVRYQWIQIAGPAVTLTGGTSPTARFIAPVVSTETIMTFLLRVDDGQATTLDRVDITVSSQPRFGLGCGQ